jgi:hypothetical protein
MALVMLGRMACTGPEFNSFEVEIINENLRRYKSPAIEQILAELIHAGGNILCTS